MRATTGIHRKPPKDRWASIEPSFFQLVDGPVLDRSAFRTFAAGWYSTGAGAMAAPAEETSLAR